MKFRNASTKPLTALVLGLSLSFVPALALHAQGNDASLQQDVQHELSGKRFAGVQVHVQDGVVTLTGQVNSLNDKLDAEKKAKKVHHADVRDEIEVTGGEHVSDQELRAKLSKALIYDRVGYGTTTFNALTLQVHDGVVTVGGVVVEPADKDSAINLIKTTPGVRGLVDKIQVAPPSPMDDRIRLAEARAVYGAPQLNRYALNPAKPIRISVVNGHVTLVGVVDSQADKDVAGIRANGVPGVFSVTNDLQVAGQVEH